MENQKLRAFLAHAVAFTAATSCWAAPTVTVPDSAPTDGVSQVVFRDFAGYAFEQSSMPRYALDNDGKPNQFSQNLVADVARRTGGRPLIRLGGTRGDYARLVPDQKEPALPIAEADKHSGIGNTTIGPSYWATGLTFDDALFVVQTPLAVADNASESIAWARSAVDHLGIDRIYSFEPGNEPDLYPAKGLGPPDYQGKLTTETYVGNYTRYAAAIANAVDLPTGRFFQAFDVAWHVHDPVAGSHALDVAECFGLGLDDGGIVKTVAHHFYQADDGSAADLGTKLMNHSAIEAAVDLIRPQIDWLRVHQPDVPFVMSEVGNAINHGPDYAYQAALGSALWLVDFQLYGLTAGVRRFYLQQIMHAGFNLWLPVASGGIPAQVFSNFYALPFVTDFVGSSGSAQVSQVEVEAEDTGNVAAYVAYEDGAPRRLAVLDLGYWNRSSSAGPRGSQNISVAVPNGAREVRVDVLSSPEGAGAQANSITYGGSQWTYESLGKEVKGRRNDSETLVVEAGRVSVKVWQSSAVMLHFLS